MPKSKDAFRTISEVADWLETPAHVLRFWESKFTQVKPVKRAGGRRYYRPADMQLLGGIKKLLHDDGLTIKGAQKLLREHGVKHVTALSQPLEDELLDAVDLVEEAAYEADAQPAPESEPASTILSFPNRSEEVADPKPTAIPPAPVATPDAESAEAQSAPPVTSEPVTAEQKTDNSTDTPAFGSDALPSFLRRTPSPSETSTATPKGGDVAKVTIDPVARLEPIAQGEDQSPAAQETTPKPVQPAAPVAREPEKAPESVTKPTTSATAKTKAPPVVQRPAPVPMPTPTPTPTPKPAAVPVPVPTADQVAPELASYTAKPGVLASMSDLRRISPELATLISQQLVQLRALRARMQNH